MSSKGSRTLINTDPVVLMDGKSITRGVFYPVPIVFRLPLGLEGTAKYESSSSTPAASGGEKKSGLISYSLTVKFTNPTDPILDFPRFDEDVIVRRPVPRSIHPITDEQEERVVRCCCIHTGDIGRSLSVDKSAYFPGDTVEFESSLNPSTSSIIRGIAIEFGSTIQASHYFECGEIVSTIGGEHEETIIDSRPADKSERKFRMSFTIPEDAPRTVIGSASCRMHFVAVKIQTTSSTFPANFYIMVYVLPKDTPDFSPYPNSLQERMAEVMPGQWTERAPETLKMPHSIIAHIQPRSPYHQVIVPEY